MLPKNINKNLLEMPLQPGNLVMYENDNLPYIAVILAFKAQKFTVLNMREREAQLASNRLYQLPGQMPVNLTSIKSKAEYLLKLYEQCHKTAGNINLHEIWDLVVEEGLEFEVARLCKLYYGKDDLETHLALRLALIEDRVFFRRNKNLFAPRSKEIITELKRNEDNRKEKLQIQKQTIEFILQMFKNANASRKLPQAILPNIKLLEEIAAGCPHLDPARVKEGKELIDLASAALEVELSGSKENRAFCLLQKLGHFQADTNLAIIRHKIPVDFPNEVSQEASKLKTPLCLADCSKLDQGLRQDFTRLQCLTIDDDSTLDMDDAISLEETANGYTLGIHISDVACLVEPNSKIDLFARKKATSIYTPDLVINMLPQELAEDKLSLIKQKVRPCLSCMFSLDRKLKILKSEVVPTLIKVSHRYNYEQVDALLESQNDSAIMHQLYNIALNLEEERLRNGALKVSKRDVAVVVLENGDFKLVEFDEHGPARGMIGELMILANKTLAQYALDNKIPIIFRGQPGPDEESFAQMQNQAIPEGAAADYAVRAKLKKSTMSLRPEPHATLALKAYTQVTSPIRRYADLIIQRQILNFLRLGKPFYSVQQLEEILEDISEAISLAQSAARESKRYWLLKYLERIQQKRQSIKGTVLRTDLKNPLVELDQVFMPTLIRTNKPIKPGDILELRITAVLPREDYLRVEY